MSVKISVIVPVYNTSHYLSRCLESILTQTYSNVEIVIVDDGSSDNSGQICDEYARTYSNVIVFHKDNEGVGSARNKALELVTGEWLLFCDSDDTLVENAIQNLSEHITYDVDCIVAGYNEVNVEGDIIYTSSSNYKQRLTYSESLLDIYKPMYLKYNGFLWNRLIRASVVHSNHLRFKEDIYYREDGLFLTELICCSKKDLLYISTPVYNYYTNPSGAMFSLSKGFSYKFLSELDSRILSNNVVRKSTSIFDYKLRYKAAASVIEGYDWIISLMNKFAVEDNIKREDLLKRTKYSVSPEFYMIYRLYKKIQRLLG